MHLVYQPGKSSGTLAAFDGGFKPCAVSVITTFRKFFTRSFIFSFQKVQCAAKIPRLVLSFPQHQRAVKIFPRPYKIPPLHGSEPPKSIGLCCGVQANGFCNVVERAIPVAQITLCHSTAQVGISVFRLKPYGSVQKFYRMVRVGTNITLVPQYVRLGKRSLGLGIALTGKAHWVMARQFFLRAACYNRTESQTTKKECYPHGKLQSDNTRSGNVLFNQGNSITVKTTANEHTAYYRKTFTGESGNFLANRPSLRYADCMSAPQSRIAIMLPRFSRYGGVEQFGYHLATKLAARGHAVDFICARQEADAPEGVTVVPVGRVGGIKVLKMLWFLLLAESARKKGNYDLTISLGKTWNQDITRVGGGPLQAFWRLSEQAWPAGMPRLRKRLARWLQPANWLTLCIEKRMFTRTPCVVAISTTVGEWVTGVYPHLASTEMHGNKPPLVTEQAMHIIYNRPDTSRFSPVTPELRATARARLGIGANDFALGVATTNFALKGVAQLIDALRLLPKDTHLYVAGGRNPARYTAAAEKEGVASRVHFCGKVNNMQEFYHALDLFILPTFYDTLANVVLEALACGVQAVCSDRAGASAFLPGSHILRDPGNPEAIAAIIQNARAQEKLQQLNPPYPSGFAAFIELVEQELARKKEKMPNEY